MPDYDAFLFEVGDLGFGDGGRAGEGVDFLYHGQTVSIDGINSRKAYESASFEKTVRNRSASLSGCSNEQHLDRSHVDDVVVKSRGDVKVKMSN